MIKKDEQMLSELKYSSAIKDFPLLFLETKRISILLDEGLTCNEIIIKSMEENIFQLQKERRRKELPQKIFKRLLTIEEKQINMIAHGDLLIAKILVFVALVKTDKLFFEFMNEVYGYKRDTIKILEDKDFMLFFEQKSELSDIVAKWKADNLTKIKSSYKKILLDIGLLEKKENELRIVQPIIDAESINIICQGNEKITDSFL
jgi:hypothetical protein